MNSTWNFQNIFMLNNYLTETLYNMIVPEIRKMVDHGFIKVVFFYTYKKLELNTFGTKYLLM